MLLKSTNNRFSEVFPGFFFQTGKLIQKNKIKKKNLTNLFFLFLKPVKTFFLFLNKSSVINY